MRNLEAPMDIFSFLSQNQSTEFQAAARSDSHYPFQDETIKDFYTKMNGGGFFSDSLIIYPQNNATAFSFEALNRAINARYSKYVGNHVYFGCDVFGNQYGYIGSRVFVLNIESGGTEILADSFKEFIELLSCDSDYYTGEPFAKAWNSKQGTVIQPDRRLCPAYPFVLGGEYVADRMYEMNIHDVLDYNENIARQIFGLPDGTDIEIKLTK